jgi:hypothetical protein
MFIKTRNGLVRPVLGSAFVAPRSTAWRRNLND